MITFCHSIFPIKNEQKLSKNVEKKIEEFSDKEMSLFWYVYNMRRLSTYNILNYEESDDITHSIRNCTAIFYDYMINKEFENFFGNISDKDFIDNLYNYISWIKSSDDKSLNIIENAVDKIKQYTLNDKKYSFSCAVKTLKKKKVKFNEGIDAIKSMFFARDFFDIESIIILRNRIINLPDNEYQIKRYVMSGTPSKNIMAVLFHDYMLVEKAIEIAKNIYLCDIEYDDDFTEAFDYICIHIYCRYILDLYMLMAQCDSSGFFDEKKLEIGISKIYNSLNIIIYGLIYKYLSINESIAFITSSLIDDICVHTQASLDIKRIERSVSISGAISRDSGHEDYSEKINEICKIAYKKWELGSDLDHIDMIEYFKKLKKYKELFLKRGFERNLSDSIKKLCRDNGIKLIRGVDVPSRKKKA